MSFSFNEGLVMETNPIIEGLLSALDKEKVVKSMEAVILGEITVKGLKEEFQESFKGFNYRFIITDEHIKNHFVIVLNGIEKIWCAFTKEYETLHEYQTYPLFENIFTYFDQLVDELDFEKLFKNELALLNKD